MTSSMPNVKDSEWSTPFCLSCACMLPMAPYPWFDTSPTPGPGTGETPRTCLGLDPELWTTPPCIGEQLGCCCCWTLAESFAALGMLDDDSLPCKMSKCQCFFMTFACCIAQQVGLPVLPYYVGKLRMRAAETFGIKQSSFCYNFGAGFVTGPVANQISRELILRNRMPRAKEAPLNAKAIV